MLPTTEDTRETISKTHFISSSSSQLGKLRDSMKYKASSTEDISITGKDKKHSLGTQDESSRYYLPLPLSAALGVTSFSDSKLYNFHQSHEFLTFLTQSALDLEEKERSATINSAIQQINEMNNILEECEKMAKFITSSQEYNPSPHIDDKTMLNIRTELTDYRSTVEALNKRSTEYKDKTILAESDLAASSAVEQKSELSTIKNSLTWMCMIIRYHTWGPLGEDSVSYSDEEVFQQRRNLSRKNCLKKRVRPRWAQDTT